MIAIPAVDLREGACVQLVGGSYDAERVRLGDPVQVARDWSRQGFRRLHVVDLDAATGRGDNAGIIHELLAEGSAHVQVGGGVRTRERAADLIRDGATAAILGTRAVEDPSWLAEIAHELPGRVIVAADVRLRQVVTHGWARSQRRDVLDFVEEITELPLAGILVTAVHKEGLVGGADLDLMQDVVDVATVPVLAAGGIANRGDLDALAERGVTAAVIGMALYTGAIDPRLLAEEYQE